METRVQFPYGDYFFVVPKKKKNHISVNETATANDLALKTSKRNGRGNKITKIKRK